MNIQVIDDFFDFANNESKFKFMLYWLKQNIAYNEYSSEGSFDNDVEYNAEYLQKIKSGSHLSGEISLTEDKLLPNVGLTIKTNVLQSILKKISDITQISPEKIKVYRYHLNMHFPDVGGKIYHYDDCDVTAVYCLSDTDGYFEYIDEFGESQKIEDKFNRLIVFQEPKMKHKGVPPTSNENGPRLNIAVKVGILNNSNN